MGIEGLGVPNGSKELDPSKPSEGAPSAPTPAQQRILLRRKQREADKLRGSEQREAEKFRAVAVAERRRQLIAHAHAELREIAQRALEQLQAIGVNAELEERELSDSERYGHSGQPLGHSAAGTSIFLRDDEVTIRIDMPVREPGTR